MLKYLLDLAKWLFGLTQETERNKSDIKERRAELKDVREAFHQLTLVCP